MVILFFLGRILVGGYFIYNGINHFRNLAGMTGYAASKKIPQPKAAVIIGGIMLILGGLSILLGFEMMIGMIILVAFLLPTTILMHPFWKEKDQMARMQETIQFTKNIALIGMLLMTIGMVFVFLV